MAAIPINPDSAAPSEKNTGRVEAFSDGVIAIAITLLVLELHVPQIAEGAPPSELIHSLVTMIPNYIAFLTSFGTIGVMWLNHHNLFKLIQRVDHWFLVLNGFLLLGISFVSFPTALFAEYMFQPSGTVAAVFYASTFVMIAIGYNLLFRYAAAHGLLSSTINMEFIPVVKRQYRFALLLYIIAAIVGVFSPLGTYIIITLLAVFFTLPNRTVAELDAAEAN